MDPSIANTGVVETELFFQAMKGDADFSTFSDAYMRQIAKEMDTFAGINSHSFPAFFEDFKQVLANTTCISYERVLIQEGGDEEEEAHHWDLSYGRNRVLAHATTRLASWPALRPRRTSVAPQLVENFFALDTGDAVGPIHAPPAPWGPTRWLAGKEDCMTAKDRATALAIARLPVDALSKLKSQFDEAVPDDDAEASSLLETGGYLQQGSASKSQISTKTTFA